MLDAKTISEKVPKFAAALQSRHGNDWQLVLKKTSDMMIGLGNDNLLNEKTFSKIKNPVFIGLADNDTMVTVSESDNSCSQIEKAKRYTLQDTKHPIETVKVNELVRIIGTFIGK
jgi:hypothetical protein